MNLPAILEVAIGIVFIWMILSIATMQIQEWIRTFMQKRSKDLEEAIRKMLVEPSSGKFFERFKLADYFYDHPIIKGLTAEKGKRPSYIPARQFATALFDIAMTAGTEAFYLQHGLYSLRQDINKTVAGWGSKKDREALEKSLDELIGTARKLASSKAAENVIKNNLSDLKEKIKNFSKNLVEVEGQGGDKPVEKYKYPEIVDAAKEVVNLAEDLYNDFLKEQKLTKASKKKRGSDKSLDQIRNGLLALSMISPDTSRTMEALLLKVEGYATQTETSIAIARANIEQWFDSSMDRISGVFKRHAQWWALFIGAFLALVLNVDSIALTKHLWREPTTRQVLVGKADEFKFDETVAAEDPNKAMQQFNEQLSGLDLPIGWSVNTIDTHDNEDINSCQPSPADEDQYFGMLWFAENKCLNPTTPDNSTNWGLKLIGIFISGLATMQGAPYWFDILKKLVNVRGNGVKPEEKKG